MIEILNDFYFKKKFHSGRWWKAGKASSFSKGENCCEELHVTAWRGPAIHLLTDKGTFGLNAVAIRSILLDHLHLKKLCLINCRADDTTCDLVPEDAKHE